MSRRDVSSAGSVPVIRTLFAASGTFQLFPSVVEVPLETNEYGGQGPVHSIRPELAHRSEYFLNVASSFFLFARFNNKDDCICSPRWPAVILPPSDISIEMRRNAAENVSNPSTGTPAEGRRSNAAFVFR